MTKGKIYIKHISTPAGGMILGSYEDRLCLCDWDKETRRKRLDHRIEKRLNAEMEEGESTVIILAAKELTEYFARQRTTFDVPLLQTGTDFQTQVWNQLLAIPYGQTQSYGEMALRMGCPKAVRAVANANGANAISLFIPCHRIIGSDGSLTGYAGGLEAKRLLLSLESQ